MWPRIFARPAVAPSLPAHGQVAPPAGAGPVDLALPLSLGLPSFWVQSFVTRTWTAFEPLHSLALILAAGLVAIFVWSWNRLGVI